MNKILSTAIVIMVLIIVLYGCSMAEPSASSQITIAYTGNVTDVTGTFPIVSSGGTHPLISINYDTNTMIVSSNTLGVKSGVYQLVGDYATKTGSEELTNKTLNASVAKGTWTALGTWKIPAVTFNGLVDANSNKITNINELIMQATCFIRSAVNNSYTTIIGGVDLSSGSFIQCIGGNYSAPATGAIYMGTPNAAKSNGVVRFKMTGAVDIGEAILTSISNFRPTGTGVINSGDGTDYWADISYKTLTDRGCLGSFDDGVELPDGSVVSDVQALQKIKVDANKLTVYGVPMFDYSSMPKAVYKPASIADEDIYFPEEIQKDGTFLKGQLRFAKGEKAGSDGAETTALISIMIGAIKEQATQIESLEIRLKALKAK